MAHGFRFPETFWLFGCGNMAGAMLARWLEQGVDPAGITVIRKSGRPVAPGVRVLTGVPTGERPPAALMIGVKPQMLDAVADGVAAAAGPQTLLLSIMAGTTTGTLGSHFPRAGAIVRAMPNTPVAIGRGVVGLHAARGTDDQRALAMAMMQPLGLAEWIADEALFDAVTALSGSGPAFLFRFIDALARGGAALGLPADQAARFACATVEGAAVLAAAADEDPGALAERVASPGGSTRKGLDVLDEGDALTGLVTRTLEAARRRNAEMAAGK